MLNQSQDLNHGTVVEITLVNRWIFSTLLLVHLHMYGQTQFLEIEAGYYVLFTVSFT